MPSSSNPDISTAPTEDWLRAVGREFAGYLHVLSVVLLSAACALLIWSAVWMAHPRSYQDWNADKFVLGFLCATGPFIAASVSLHALGTRTPIQSRAGRFCMRTAIVVPVSIALLFASLARLIAADALNSTSDFPIVAGPGLLLGMTAIGAIRLLLPAHDTPWMRERVLHGLIVASVCVPVAGLLLWSVLNIALVEWRAYAIAGSEPYCLQVPAESHSYKPVTRWSELAGLRMQTPFEVSDGATSYEWQWLFHALLIVKRDARNDFYNWSYFAQNFVPVSEHTRRYGPVIADCEPKPDFLYTLQGF